MNSLKVLNINYSRYKYPANIATLGDFIDYINQNEKGFIPIEEFCEENCVFPFLVAEDIKTVFINFSNVPIIFEEEATVLCRADYDERLDECVEAKCTDCEFYEEDILSDNLDGHKSKLCLDGTCFYYSKM